MKMIKKKSNKVDKEDLGFQEDILEEGFSEEPIGGKLINSFSFEDKGPSN